MALLPLGWLAWRGERRPEWWWLAGSFAVPWLADTLAHVENPWLPAAVYPLGQAAMVGAVFLRRAEARAFVIVLAVVGIVAVLWESATGPAVLLQTVAYGGVAGIVWSLRVPRLRVTLLTAFGVGLVAWWGYVLQPGWTSWIAYQLVRAVSLAMFCWASLEARPRLRLA